jgi:hypothetical protein
MLIYTTLAWATRIRSLLDFYYLTDEVMSRARVDKRVVEFEVNEGSIIVVRSFLSILTCIFP